MFRRITAIIFVALLTLVISSIVLSYNNFKVYNPLLVLSGLFQVIVMEKDYIQIQDYPKVILANHNTLLEDYMQELGYIEEELDELTMNMNPGLRVFNVAAHQNFIIETDRKYYSVWMWR